MHDPADRPRRRRIVPCALSAVCAIALATPAPVSSQGRPDFSGTWTSSPERFVALRNAPRERNGWGGQLEGVAAAPTYTIAISQSEQSVALTFPGGTGNFLTRPAFPLDGAPHSTVQDAGEFWTKIVSSATWDGSRLVLDAKSLNGWWKEVDPSQVTTQETELGTRFVLELNPSGDVLTLSITVRDEKGEAEYRQVFSRG
jgi:hypothetical protein